MDDRTRQHVFEPFFTTKNVSKGTGLGLATVFGVVTQAGGHLMVASEPGHGSAFDLYFPRLMEAAAAVAVAEAEETPVTLTGTVLLVEDHIDVRQLSATILRNMGFEVLEAGDGDEALAVAEACQADIRLMLTDVIMPGMNGKQLADKMLHMRPQIRVIFMSGYTGRIMSRDGMLDESVDYLQKPFTAQELNAMVRRALE